jgi:hypothetical protein
MFARPVLKRRILRGRDGLWFGVSAGEGVGAICEVSCSRAARRSTV